MPPKFKLADHVIFLMLILIFYNATILPGSAIMYNGIVFIQFFLFISFFSLKLKENILKNPIPKVNTFNIIFFLILLVFFYSAFRNIDTNKSISSLFKLLSYFVLLILLFFYFSKRILKNELLFEKFLSYLIYTGIFVSLISLVTFFTGLPLNTTYSAMTTGIFIHPNTASHIFTILVPVTIYKYFSKKISLSFFLFLIILFLVTLLFTLSRAGYIGTLLAILIITYSKSKKIFFITIFFLIISVYLVILDFTFAKSNSSISRIILWATAYDMIVRDLPHTLFGYGVTEAITLFRNEKFFFGSIEDVPDPHNTLLLFSIQFGVIFTFLILLIVILNYVKIFFIRKKDYYIRNKLKIFLCISITVGLSVQNMMENILAYPEHFVMAFYFIFLGCLFNVDSLKSENG